MSTNETNGVLYGTDKESAENGVPAAPIVVGIPQAGDVPANVPATGDTPGAESDILPAGDTFPRDYVERLRTESAGHRTAAAAATAAAAPLLAELHTFKVAALGKLADPTDLPYAPGLDTPELLAAAVDELLAAKPHLAARTVTGDIGGHESGAPEEFSLAAMLRAGA